MDKKTSIIVVIIGAIFFFGAAVFLLLPEKPKQGVEPAPAPAATTTRPVVAVFETEKIVGKYYTITLEYPKSSATERAEIGQYIDKLRGEFLDAVPKTDEEAEYVGLDGSRKYTFDIKTTTYTSSTTVTYKIETYMYTGGAHGMTFDTTFTYDAKGKLLTLADVYPDTNALSKISAAARTHLYAKLGTSSTKAVIDVGTEPKPENFSAWYMTDEGITFIFQQYQIGPYTIGIQEFPFKPEIKNN